MNSYKTINDIVLNELIETCGLIDSDDVETLISKINSANKIFFVGVGRVLLSLQSFAKRLAHLGYDVYIVGQITEPAIGKGDLLIVGSGSGESSFPLIIAKKAFEVGSEVAHIGSSPNSSMSEYSSHFVQIPVNNKVQSNGIDSQQPMTSLFEQSLLILGDTICFMIVKERSIDIKELWQYHANLE